MYNTTAQGSILHLFHGELQKLQYISRINGALKYKLNLDQDLNLYSTKIMEVYQTRTQT